ncbi:MAG: Putrescine transport system permease protein PotH, partial [uncultured Solirubrobacteraceae bacterium]
AEALAARPAAAAAVDPARPGAAVARAVLRDPAGQPGQRLAAVGGPGDGLRLLLGVRDLRGRGGRLLRAVRALAPLRGGRDAPVLRDRVPARVLRGVQGGAPEAALPGADHPAVLHVLRPADGGVAAHPRRRRVGGRAAAGRRGARRRRPPARVEHGGDRGHHLQLPALHGAAAVRLARADGPAADRGGDRPLREPGARVPAGDAAARAPGDLRGLAADLHPGVRRLHQRLAAGDAAAVDGRQRHPVEVPDDPRLSDRGGALVHPDDADPRRGLPLRAGAGRPDADPGGAV